MGLGEIFAVVSGKGGTGKTSVCAGVATALAESGRRVLCIDCDVGLRNLDISLGMTDSCVLSFQDVSEHDYSLSDASTSKLFPNLAFLTSPANCRPEEINADAFRELLHKARSEYDYVFLDAPAGVDTGFQLVSTVADRFLLVTGPGPAAVRDAVRVGQLLELEEKENVRLVINRVDRDLLSTLQMTLDDVMDTTGIPLAGYVTEDPHVTLAAAFGLPLLKYAPRCDAAKACRRIAGRIQGYYRPMPLR